MLLCDKYRIWCLCESVLQSDKESIQGEQGKETTPERLLWQISYCVVFRPALETVSAFKWRQERSRSPTNLPGGSAQVTFSFAFTLSQIIFRRTYIACNVFQRESFSNALF